MQTSDPMPPNPAPVDFERPRSSKMIELGFVLVFFVAMCSVILGSLFRDDGGRGEASPVAAVVAPSVTPQRVSSNLALSVLPDRLTNSDDATFAFTWSGDASTTFECRIDEGEFKTCEIAGAAYSDLADGTHTFQVREVSDAPADQRAIASYAWTIDTTVPEVSISPDSTTFTTVLFVDFGSTEPADIYYTTDGSEPGSTTSRYSRPIEIERPSVVKAVAIDRAGNKSEVGAATFSFDVSFADDFESGALDLWSDLDGAELDPGSRHQGELGLHVQSVDGDNAYATIEFAESVPEVFVATSFRLNARGENPVTLVRARAATGESLASVYVAANGRLGIQFANGESITSSAIIPTGAWFTIQYHVRTTGGETTMDVWLDGKPLKQLSLSRESASNPIASLQFGESSNGRLFDLSFDEVTLDDAFIASSAIVIIEAPDGDEPVPAATPEP